MWNQTEQKYLWIATCISISSGSLKSRLCFTRKRVSRSANDVTKSPILCFCKHVKSDVCACVRVCEWERAILADRWPTLSQGHHRLSVFSFSHCHCHGVDDHQQLVVSFVYRDQTFPASFPVLLHSRVSFRSILYAANMFLFAFDMYIIDIYLMESVFILLYHYGYTLYSETDSHW